MALCFAEAGSRVPENGGPYAYIEAALGPYVGYICGVLLWLGITLAMAAVATVFADAFSSIFPVFAGQVSRVVLLAAMLGLLAWVNIRGTALGSRVNTVSTLVKLLPLVAFVVLGLSHVDPANLTITTLPPLGAVGEAGLLLMFAFFGMESALQVSGEVTDASRTVPRAIALALSGVALLYISVQLVAQGVLGSALAAPATATAPLAAAAAQFVGPSGAKLILVAMALSTFGFMTGMMLSTPRTLLALAADGFFPRPLARVHPVYRTPHVAIAVQAVIVGLIAITGTYVKLAILADVAVLIVYLACSVGAGQLRRRNVGSERNPFVMPAGGVVPWLAAALIVGLLVRASLSAWLLTGGVMAMATLSYLLRGLPPRHRVVVLAGLVLAVGAEAQTPAQQARTPTVDSADTYFGTRVADPYRWLEHYDSSKGASDGSTHLFVWAWDVDHNAGLSWRLWTWLSRMELCSVRGNELA